jgi:hypothetical protein
VLYLFHVWWRWQLLKQLSLTVLIMVLSVYYSKQIELLPDAPLDAAAPMQAL